VRLSVRPDLRAHRRSSALSPSQAQPEGEVTRLLRSAREGDADALGRLIPLLYDDLRQLAQRQLRREHGARTLQATALVHEAYAKLAAGGSLDAGDRAHFFALAARAMRQVLVDEARRRKSGKRGGDWVKTTLSGGEQAVDYEPDELLALDEALVDLSDRERQVVELRFFAGLEETEIAALLGISDRTVRREWTKARAALYKRLYLDPPPS
jgi:RNA polymerase sigma factor (TIGR02999 family)